MSLGELSTLLVWGAVTAYAVAFVAFAVDLARLADSRATATPVAAGGGDPARDVAVPAPAPLPPAPPAPAPRRAVGIAMATTVAGLALHVAGTVLRGLAAGRVPWANMYEFALVGSLVAVVTFLVLCRRRDLRFLGTIVLGIAVIGLGVGLAVFYTPASPVEPALQSYWLVIHVSIATVATGMFAVAFASSVLQLLKDARDTGSARLAARRWALLDALPPTRDLEALSFRITAVAFVLWTFTVMAGAVWAEHTWGRYWGWDPKEVWSFVVWVVYAAYLHARTTRGWSGRRAAWFVVVGFATVIFNFTGVNLLFQGLHDYGGVG